jgi:DNA-binding IscR family transcriptional regulator
VDGAFTESSCTHARERLGSECAEGENCGLRRLWQDVQDAMEKILFETSLDDLRRSSSDVVGRKQPLARIHAS